LDLRSRRIVASLDLKGIGLEYGPLHRVVADKEACHGVRYVDFAPREVLAKKYKDDPNVDIELIPEIDIVTNGMPISQFVEPGSLDFIIASHVLEHVPDLVGWLSENLSLLRPGGRIGVAFPDRRYCFDLGRNRTILSDLVAAHLEARTRPSFAQICDHIMNVRKVNPVSIWAGSTTKDNAPFMHDNGQALQILGNLLQRDDYIDVHCWKFADVEMQSMLNEIKNLFGIPFVLLTFFPVQPNSIEFYFTLEKTG